MANLRGKGKPKTGLNYTMKKSKLRGLSSMKGGELLFTIENLGRGEFHVKITKEGQFYFQLGINSDIPHKWNNDDILKLLYEYIDLAIFKGDFELNHYIPKTEVDDGIPF